MKSIYPNKLKKGDKIAIIAPSDSLAIISQETRAIANETFQALGLEIVFGKNADNTDKTLSSSIEARVADLRWAFEDSTIQGIFTAIGGYNSNQLLNNINWEVIKNNPKIFCGYSDINILSNAIFKITGLITYSGPHYSTLGQRKELDYTLINLIKCLFQSEPQEIIPSDTWTDDEWWKNQDDRKIMKNTGWKVINEGISTGTSIGGNLSSFKLLKGTKFMPDLNGTILFLEEEGSCEEPVFDRELQSFIHLNGFNGVKGLVIGRFQKDSGISSEQITEIIKSKKELSNIPVLIDVDFGHTNPMLTFPIGGFIKINCNEKPSLELVNY